MWRCLRFGAVASMLAVLVVAPARGQDQGAALPCGLGMVERPSGIAAANIRQAAFHQAQSNAGELRVTFVGHATFLLETPDDVSLATDYNGYNVPLRTPDIVTMNNFHYTHFTDFPDPAIKYVLRGWDDAGGIARRHLKLKDLRVYSVPTNIRDFGRGPSNGNSIFVFDTVGLCLAHLSHLHHDLTAEEASGLGRIDVLFVPIDGRVTMSHDEVIHVIDVIKPRLVIVMHWDIFGGPGAFFARVQGLYSTRTVDSNVLTLTRDRLPTKTEIVLMPPEP